MQLGYEDLQVAGESEYTIRLSFGVRSDWPTFVDILNKTLAGLSDTQKSHVYQRWIPLQPAVRTDYRLLIFVLAGAVLVILVFFFWNRSLGREVRRRNAALRELRRTQEQLIQSEKMASIGTLVSGIAHELNNPLNYITTGLTALKKQLQGVSEAGNRDGGAIPDRWSSIPSCRTWSRAHSVPPTSSRAFESTHDRPRPSSPRRM